MPQFIQNILSWIMIYDDSGNPKMLESCFAFFGFLFILYFMIEVFAIIKSSTKAVM